MNLVESERSLLMKGSGVDTNLFKVTEEPKLPVRLTLVSRMLWDKGVGEFVDAVRKLKNKDLDFTATLVGHIDDQNPSAIDEKVIKEWVREGLVEYWGRQEDIPNIWKISHVSVLPSYHEGLPKTLIEAASCSRPIVATKIDGCMEIVKDSRNGYLVPVKDSLLLSRALEKLILELLTPENKMKIDSAINSSVRNLIDFTKTKLKENIVQANQSELISLSEKDLAFLTTLVESTVTQAFALGYSDVETTIKNIKNELNIA